MIFVRLLVLPLFLLGLSLNLLRAETYGPISVQDIPLAENRSDETVHGYVEYRFRVTNRDSKPHHVALQILENDHGSSANLTRSTNEVDVPPGTGVTLSLLQPPVNMSSSGRVQVRIDGRLQKDPTTFANVANHILPYSRRSNETANVFVSQLVPADMRDLIRTGVSSTTSSSGPSSALPATPPFSHSPSSSSPEVNCWLANAPVGEWSENWLAYSRFDGVVLTSGEWKDLKDQFSSISAALRKYVEVGGVLCIVGKDWTPPKEWVLSGDPQKRFAQFGTVSVIEGTTDKAKPEIDPLRDLLFEQVKPWENALNLSSRGGRFSHGLMAGAGSMGGGDTTLKALPVIESYGVPVKLIMILIVVFAVLIGPVNIYVLSLINRRIWLLWTGPVTSLIASILVLGVNFVQEGFLKQSSSKTTTILDQRTGEATTIGYLGFYSTLTPRGGIVFDADTEATACFNRGYGESRSVDLEIVGGGNQHFSRGWINARVPAYFAIRKAQSHRKERIVFDWTASPPTATNGLGVDVKSLIVRSPKGETYRVEGLKTGLKTPLAAALSTGEPPDPGAELQTLLRQTIQNGPTSPSFNPAKILTNGSYLMEIDAWNPFVEHGIERMNPYQNATTVYGIFE